MRKIASDGFKSFLEERHLRTSKEDYGNVLLIAGYGGMGGAATLAALAALRTGSGLVRAATPEKNRPLLLTWAPEAICLSLQKALQDLTYYDALAVGPGMGQNILTEETVRQILHVWNKPLVLDADALNVIAGSEELRDALRHTDASVILTPHMGEAGRLLGTDIKARLQELQGKIKKSKADDLPVFADPPADEGMAERETIGSDAVRGNRADNTWGGNREDRAYDALRFTFASRLADDLGTVTLFKGYRTLVTEGLMQGMPEAERRIYINQTGNPGMGTAGSGDVLTGMILSLCGQGVPPFEAAALGAYLHGLAGDLAARKRGMRSLLARDIVSHIAAAYREACEPVKRKNTEDGSGAAE